MRGASMCNWACDRAGAPPHLRAAHAAFGPNPAARSFNEFKGLRELGCFFRLFQQRQVLKDLQPFGSGSCIARLTFAQNNLRNIQLKFRSPPVPPIARNLLMGGANQIAASPRSQVTWDGRFEVDMRLHCFIVPNHYVAFNVLQPS